MKRTMILGAMAGILLHATACAAQVALTGVTTSVLPGYTRITLTFDGEVRYSQLPGDGSVRLGLSHTAVAISAKGRHKVMNSGHVSAIAITPLPNDSAIVTIGFQGAATYRCILPASGNALYVDILPSMDGSLGQHAVRPAVEQKPAAPKPAGTTVVAAIARKPIRKEQAKPAPSTQVIPPEPVAPIRAYGVVDIPALAREQAWTGTGEPASHVAASESARQGIPPAMALGLAALVVLSMIGTGVGLSFILRRTPSEPVAELRSVLPPAPAAPSLEQMLATSHKDILIDDVDDEDESRFAHDTSLQLARTFRRGSEEITLARRLHTQAAPQLTGARMQETLSHATTTNQRLHIARKLGVGRGEMDLAAKLRTIHPAEKKEEVPS
jgi:hypothetical protein